MRPVPAALIATAVLAGCTAVPAPQPTSTAVEVPFQQVRPSDAQALAVPYIGLAGDDALTKAEADGVTARIGSSQDVGEPGIDPGYQVGRLTLILSDDTVAEVIVETDEGPVTVAAS